MPFFAPNLASLGRSFEGLLPRAIKFVRYCGGSTRFGRRMHDEVGFVAELTEGFCQKAEIAVSTLPLSGMGVGRIQSKALIRSVLTMSIAGPNAEWSRR